jgi:EEF1A lysine methyltransferase 4
MNVTPVDEAGGDEDILVFNWDALSHTLSPAALAALQAHAHHNIGKEVNVQPIGDAAADDGATTVAAAAATTTTTTTVTDDVNAETNQVSNIDSDSATVDFRKYGVAAPNAVFKLHSYWEDRFATEESFEWLVGWKQVSNQVEKYLKKSDRILIVGCGNCSFSADIYDAGYENIVNIDFSEMVIDKMRQIHSISRPNMSWEVMDMTKMTFEDNAFDVVLDKAAMDALVVDEGDVWDPTSSVIATVDQMSLSVNKVLNKDHGIFLQISFAQPHFRTKYLMGYRAANTPMNPYDAYVGHSERYHWNLSHEIIDVEGGCLSTFLYVMKRK